jgi:hypothetical protein
MTLALAARSAGLALAAAVLVNAPHARAQSPSETDQALAQALFEQGKALMSAGKYAQACAKFAASNRTAPGTGTLLNLAVCHMKAGKLASAWVEFSNAADADRRAGDRQRLAFDESQMKALSAKLAHITIVVPPAAQVSGLALTIDGAPLSSAAIGVPTPVDPGQHQIAARAPDHLRWYTSVNVANNGDNVTVKVPALASTAPSGTAAAAAPQPSRAPAGNASASGKGTRRVAAYVAGGVGVAGLGLGTFFGLKAFSDWHTRNENCPGGRCNQAAVDAHDSAHSAAIASDISFGVGAAALAAGVYLWITSRGGSEERPPGSASARVRVTPLAGPGVGGLNVGGQF